MQLTRPYRGPGMWTTGLFDCCEDPTACVEALICPACSVSAHYNRLKRGTPGTDMVCCLTMFVPDICCLCGVTACGNMNNRSTIRGKYGIASEDDITSFCISWLCMPCAITQQYREMCYRNTYPGGLCVSPPVGQPMGFPVPAPPAQQVMIGQAVVAVGPPQQVMVAPPQPQPVMVAQTHTVTVGYAPVQQQQPTAVVYQQQPQQQQTIAYQPQPQPQLQPHQVYANQQHQPQPAMGQPLAISGQQQLINFALRNDSTPAATQPQAHQHAGFAVQQQPPQQQQYQHQQALPHQQQPAVVGYSPAEGHPHQIPDYDQQQQYVKEV